MEPVNDERLRATHDYWDQEVVSENRKIYRAEYLAYLYFLELKSQGKDALASASEQTEQELANRLQKFMAPRYTEGYVKGVHDHDAAKILKGFLEVHTSIGALRYPSRARALGSIYWHATKDTEKHTQLETKLQAAGEIAKLFPDQNGEHACLHELQDKIRDFNDHHRLFPVELVDLAASFVADEISTQGRFSASHHAIEACHAFDTFLERKHKAAPLRESLAKLEGDVVGTYDLLKEWAKAFLSQHEKNSAEICLDEVASILFDQSVANRHVVQADASRTISGLVGSHPATEGHEYSFDYLQFQQRIGKFHREDVPRFMEFLETKKEVIDARRDDLRLSEFKPRVLTSFVRNKLIDEVYLPMIGDNLAKQMGVVGEQKRTDLMGLLLLISPPGYGKTTLMEYVANRLGITFMKINGPAIGHHVTSLDPVEAPHASAREEVEKLNLSLEMGDNVMIYLDDIQHCNPEFLQKFISLCDAQRKIEGVYKGRTRTYDLRGRKVAVVMAGNPYTESGEKFQIPDMLANRADAYNLGDVIGGNQAAFEQSYLENALTSNPTLNNLATRSPKDVYAIIKMAEVDSPDGIDLEAEYSVEELNELVSTMKKLIRVRDVVLKVNEQYITSAAQADAYRTEPPFKLQGSYRDMNKMAERIVPIMNDNELETLIASHYENAAQTLTTDAEANLLKLREMLGTLSEYDAARWAEIKRTFKRNILLGGADEDDKFGRVVAQLTAFTEGLHEIKQTLAGGIETLATADGEKPQEPVSQLKLEGLEEALSSLSKFGESLTSIKESLDGGVNRIVESNAKRVPVAAPQPAGGRQEIRVVNRVPGAFLEVIRAQFNLIQAWMKPIENLPGTEAQSTEFAKLTRRTG